MSPPEIVVIGGGVIGCAVARELARRGQRVLVIERGEPGAEASWAAAGMLSPLAEAQSPGPMLSLLRESRDRFPALAAELGGETGIDVGYRDVGTLFLAFNEQDEAELEERWRWQRAAKLPLERLSASDILRLEPAVSAAVRWGVRYPEDHQVDNRQLSRALWAAAARAGADFRLGAEVVGLLWDGGRLTGVELAEGERVSAEVVVLAAGCWAGGVGGLPHSLPVFPVHGQLVALDTFPPLFAHVVDSPRCYLVPRADGRLILGATVEQVGFRKAVTPRGVMSILQNALEISPVLSEVPLVEIWAGLRPGTPDNLPILGEDPEVSNLFYATGHFRNGILLAPITAEALAAQVLGGNSTIDLRPFSLARFWASTAEPAATPSAPHSDLGG